MGSAALAVIFAVACARGPESPGPGSRVDAGTSTSLSPPVSASPVAAATTVDAALEPALDAAAEAPISAWSDPVAVLGLVKDCAWKPSEEIDATSETPSGRFSALSCKFLFEQSCVPDPCLGAQEERCKPACTATCETCGHRCSATCASCKRACASDACKVTCAETCASCRQACVQEADRCATGTCGEARQRCMRARGASLEKHKDACKKVCGMASECPGTCSAGKDMGACMTSCRKRFVSAGCPEEFFPVCAMAGPDGSGLPLAVP